MTLGKSNGPPGDDIPDVNLAVLKEYQHDNEALRTVSMYQCACSLIRAQMQQSARASGGSLSSRWAGPRRFPHGALSRQ